MHINDSRAVNGDANNDHAPDTKPGDPKPTIFFSGKAVPVNQEGTASTANLDSLHTTTTLAPLGKGYYVLQLSVHV